MRYHDRTELSFHQLMDFKKSPEYYYKKHILKDYAWRKAPSPAMDFGTAMHLAVLQPHEYAKRVRLVPDEHLTPSGELSSKRETKEWLKNKDRDIVYLSKKDRDLVDFLSERARQVFAPYFAGCEFEKEIITTLDGVSVRAQIDCISSTTVHDLKTCKNLDEARESAKSYHYIEQLVWYAKLTKTNVGSLLFVETELPYRCGILQPNGMEIESAGKIVDDTFDAYKRIKDRGFFDKFLMAI